MLKKELPFSGKLKITNTNILTNSSEMLCGQNILTFLPEYVNDSIIG
jgi:hypothetical protein